jgi:hypothetical protein
MSVENWLNDTDRKNWSSWEKMCPSAALSTTDLTLTDLGLIIGLCGKRQARAMSQLWSFEGVALFLQRADAALHGNSDDCNESSTFITSSCKCTHYMILLPVRLTTE